MLQNYPTLMASGEQKLLTNIICKVFEIKQDNLRRYIEHRGFKVLFINS